MSNGKRIAILTDSTCDIPHDMRNKHDIHVLPQTIIWGEEILLDGVDIDNDTFYKRLVSDPVHPTTSQPAMGDFARMYEKVAQDADEIVAVLVSSDLSGTLASASGAMDEVDIPVHIVDSRSASLGLGVAVLAAVDARDAGGDVATIVAAAEKRARQTNLLFVLDTLEYLHKGGRIGPAKKYLATALNLKPILHILDGRIEPHSSVRTRSKALARMLEVAADGLDANGPKGGAILHAQAEADANKVADQYKAMYDPKSLIMSEVTPVIGVHTGPGVIGVATYSL